MNGTLLSFFSEKGIFKQTVQVSGELAFTDKHEAENFFSLLKNLFDKYPANDDDPPVELKRDYNEEDYCIVFKREVDPVNMNQPLLKIMALIAKVCPSCEHEWEDLGSPFHGGHGLFYQSKRCSKCKDIEDFPDESIEE